MSYGALRAISGHGLTYENAWSNQTDDLGGVN